MTTRRKNETLEDFRQRDAAYKKEWRAKHRLIIKGTSTLFRNGVEVGRWDKTRLAGRSVTEVQQLPDPKVVTKVSTLYDQLGDVSQQWVTERPEAVAQRTAWQHYAEELSLPLPRITTPAPKHDLSKDLAAVYPIGDHHLGMLSWRDETGADYDLEIAQTLLDRATAHLVKLAPPCEQALVAFLGDFMHYDSFDAVTPTSKNVLDSDGRFPKLVQAAVRLMRRTIETAAEHHGHVRVIVEIGNHDLASSVFLMVALANIYENDPRIEVDTSPAHFHYWRWGKNLLATHHGHGPKLEQLPLIMATDRAQDWGETQHRLWMTGHNHHQSMRDMPGCSVESFRVLPPSDAWAANKGYRAARGMKALILHREHGEVGRYTVNPEMLT